MISITSKVSFFLKFMKLLPIAMTLLLGSGGAYACSCIPHIQTEEDRVMEQKVGHDVWIWMKRLKKSPNIFTAKVEAINMATSADYLQGHRIHLSGIKSIQGVVPEKNIIYNNSACPAYFAKSDSYLFTVNETMMVSLCGGVQYRSSDDEKNVARARELLKAAP
jgi:hypothetical protein